ncbi:MAG: energy transducer TonB [Gammaproteobacteria bacterium]|nr:energy transducer TonB [Gammaproteobacteria bacterium]
MSTATTPADLAVLSGSDRLGLTVFGSLLLHVLVVLGVGFTLPHVLPELDKLPNMEIILVQTRSEDAPSEADFLAQSSQDGGGDSESVASSPLPVTEISVTPAQLPTASVPAPPPTPAAENTPEDLMVDADSRRLLSPTRPRDSQRPAASARAGEITPDPRQLERAQLSAKISEAWREYQKRPRRKFLSARTREYKFAAYMDAWRAKVERVGNLNYPAEAKQRNLTGNLMLDVAINPDGSVNEISVKRSSGVRILDEAAIRIVRLASPYAPFPEQIRKDVDILHITRTWQFLRGARLKSR